MGGARRRRRLQRSSLCPPCHLTLLAGPSQLGQPCRVVPKWSRWAPAVSPGRVLTPRPATGSCRPLPWPSQGAPSPQRHLPDPFLPVPCPDVFKRVPSPPPRFHLQKVVPQGGLMPCSCTLLAFRKRLKIDHHAQATEPFFQILG